MWRTCCAKREQKKRKTDEKKKYSNVAIDAHVMSRHSQTKKRMSTWQARESVHVIDARFEINSTSFLCVRILFVYVQLGWHITICIQIHRPPRRQRLHPQKLQTAKQRNSGRNLCPRFRLSSWTKPQPSRKRASHLRN